MDKFLSFKIPILNLTITEILIVGTIITILSFLVISGLGKAREARDRHALETKIEKTCNCKCSE